MWSFEGLQRPPGDRTARAAKWEGMARSWEVVGGHCPTFWSAARAKVGQMRKVKILSGYQLTSFCTSFPTYYGFEKDGFYPQNLVSW